MSENVSNCPLCHSEKSSSFARTAFRGLPVHNRICSDCGLVYLSPRMSEQELTAFYAREYRQLYQGSEGPDPKDLIVQRGRARSLLALARSGLERPSRHLDIGCSAGLLLQRFRDELSCQAVGVEPGEAYRLYAQKQGLPVYASLEELKEGGESRFDLVSMAHVLEHLPDPVAYLANLRECLLEPHGRLLVEVPNLYGHDSFEVAHLVSYSLHTLVQVVQKAGFEVLAFHQHGQPRSLLIPLYLTLLARPAGTGSMFTLVPERGVRLKRQYGMLRRRFLTRLFPGRAWLPLDKWER